MCGLAEMIILVILTLPIWALAQNQYLMTVAGYDGSSDGCQGCPPWDNKVSLISLHPDVPVPECLQRLNDFQYLQGGCMANLLGDQPDVCGGWSPYEDYTEECYRYDPTQDMWTETGTFLTPRDGPRGYYGCTFSYSHGIVVAGGYGCGDGCSQGGPSPLGNVDYTTNGQTFGQLTELPEGIQYTVIAWWLYGEAISSVQVVQAISRLMGHQKRHTFTAMPRKNGLQLLI